MAQLHPLSRARLEQLVIQSTVVEQDSYGIKVLRFEDGRYLKYFRRKRFFSRDLLVPAAVRFARHARQLERSSIPTLKVETLYRVDGERNTVAVYEPLPGTTLRTLMVDNRADNQLFRQIGEFLAGLHRQGVFFRSVHPGNIVVDGTRIGLIDVLDMKMRPWSMSRWARRRNWPHLLRCPEDRPYWTPERVNALLQGYGQQADLPAAEIRRTGRLVHDYLSG